MKIWWHLDVEKATQRRVIVTRRSKGLQMTMLKAYSDLPIGLASTLTVQGCFAAVKGSAQRHGQAKEMATNPVLGCICSRKHRLGVRNRKIGAEQGQARGIDDGGQIRDEVRFTNCEAVGESTCTHTCLSFTALALVTPPAK